MPTGTGPCGRNSIPGKAPQDLREPAEEKSAKGTARRPSAPRLGHPWRKPESEARTRMAAPEDGQTGGGPARSQKQKTGARRTRARSWDYATTVRPDETARSSRARGQVRREGLAASLEASMRLPRACL